MMALLITARMGSSRLARKHLVNANGRPLLYWLIRRFEQAFQKEIAEGQLVMAVATSEKPGNEAFSEATASTLCRVLHGSDNNIPLRHLQCARSLQASHVLSVDGDDILCSTAAARTLFDQIRLEPGYDLYTTTGLPLGMNVSAYSVAYLEKSLRQRQQHKLETGWGRIFVRPRTWTTALGNYDIMGELRFTLDYQEDADFFCAVINELKEKIITISDEELISVVRQKQLYQINSFLKDEYWRNYNSEKEKETNEQE